MPAVINYTSHREGVLPFLRIGIIAFFLLLAALALAPSADAAPKQKEDKSDLNADLVVDLADVVIFSTNYLETHWETVDWCLFYEKTQAGEKFEGKRTKYYKDNFQLLLAFIFDHFYCGGEPPPDDALQLENQPKYLVRMAQATNTSGDYYITDPRVGSIFIYDSGQSLKAEIKGLLNPLGIAVDSYGYILVGNNGRDNVEVYDPANGTLIDSFGVGQLKMPTAISVDPDGYIYVTDSLSHNVQVFDALYNPVRTIGSVGTGDSELSFPVDAQVITYSGGGTADIQEVFVADQGNKRVQVYDLEGNWLRSIYHEGVCGWFSCTSPPFKRLQALDVDSQARLHVLDNFGASVMMFDPADGAFLNAYGEYGDGPGFLRVPMDVMVTGAETAIVTTGDGDRTEVLAIP